MHPRALLRLLALRVPIPARARLPLVLAAYKAAGPVFRGSHHYEAWRRSRTAAPPANAERAPGPKGLVAVIDQYIPRPDRDSGSRALWQMIECLLAGGWDVAFWPHFGWHEPGYTERLQALGVEVILGAQHRQGFERFLQSRSGRLGAVLVSRPLLARELVPAVRAAAKVPILYNGVDIHYERLALEARTQGRAPGPEERWMQSVEPAVWRACDIILYPSQDEIDEVLRRVPGCDARLLPLFAFDSFGTPRAPSGGGSKLFMVANFNHAPNVDGMRWLATEVLPRLRALRPGFTLEVAGIGAPQSLRAIEAPEVRWLGPVSDEHLDELYRASDLSLVPLRFGAGVKGKVVEALRWGLPLVTTPVGVQGLPRLEEIVSIHEDAAGFAQAIDELLRDPGERARRSIRMIEYARGRFTREAMARALAFATPRAAVEGKIAQ